MKYSWFLLGSLILFSACYVSEVEEIANTKVGWYTAYKHDENGVALEGSVEELIQGIRNGYDVRVGWGWEKMIGDSLVRLEHRANPTFLVVVQEKNVSIVIDAHPLLKSYLAIENPRFRDGGPIWQCVMNTKGEFNAQVYDRVTGELLKDWPQKHKITWFLEYPSRPRENAKPLYH